MRKFTWPSRPPTAHRRSARGQTLVEFALVLPMLLVLLLGVADFGRLFITGIALEAAARDGAEVAAVERLRNPPPSDPGLQPAYYQQLQEMAASTACAEMRTYQTPDNAHQAGPDCRELSAVRVCIHDGGDPRCGDPITGMGAAPADGSCGGIANPWTNASGGELASHWVEVRVCYQYQSLIPLTIALPFGNGIGLHDMSLERTRSFVVDCPPNAVSSC